MGEVQEHLIMPTLFLGDMDMHPKSGRCEGGEGILVMNHLLEKAGALKME